MTEIRLVELTRRHARVASAVARRTREVLQSGGYVGGEQLASAEDAAASILGRGSAVGVNSGTDALILALQALGLGPGSRVIVPALSFFSTASAVLHVGAEPVFVDVRKDGTLDPDAARDTPADAAIVVHLYGNIAQDPALAVPVVEDAAQLAGCTNPPRLGSLSTLSTYPTKTWGAAGDGGFVAGDDPELLARVRLLGSHGAWGAEGFEAVHGSLGRNSRLDALQAAILLAHLDDLPRRIQARRANAARLDAALPDFLEPLPRHPDSPVHQYIVRCRQRAAVQSQLEEQGIETRRYYPVTLDQHPAIRGQLSTVPQVPTARAIAAEGLALPVHAELTDGELERLQTALSGLSG